jgi:CspA family cold shock protein
MTGTVKWFDVNKGYGFIVRDDGQADVFVHASAVRFGRKLEKSDRVEFEITNGQRGAKAANVRLTEIAAKTTTPPQ